MFFCVVVQSGMATWEGDNSSTSFAEGLSGAVAAAVAAASQPQQQRQQQQLVSVGILEILKVPQIKVLILLSIKYL